MDDISFSAAGFDDTRAEAFFNQITDVLEHSGLAIMLSIGHRTGLLDCMAGFSWVGSQELADAAGLDERYVREWLAVLVTSRVVEYRPSDRTYRLPPEHAACLTRTGSLGNMAVYAQFVAMAGSAQESVIESFGTGAGIDYGAYPCFHDIMAEDSGQTVVASVDRILAEQVPELLPRLNEGIDVLDAGCGAGRAIIRMAELFPNSRFHGYDLCEDAIEMATAEAARRKVGNVTFRVQDLMRMEDRDAFDLVTSFDAVHDTADPARLLASIATALRPGGRHLMQDIGGSAQLENNFDFPLAPFLYAVSCVHCMPVSLAQGGNGLGTMWGWETAEGMLKEAGLALASRSIRPDDPVNVWFVSHKQ